MKKLEIKNNLLSGGCIAYVEDLYTISGMIHVCNLEHLKTLPTFNMLIIKSMKSRTLPICPEREMQPLCISGESLRFLEKLGVEEIITDADTIVAQSGRIHVEYVETLHDVITGYYICVETEEKICIGNPDNSFLARGTRRDGSLYSRIQWANTTEKNPFYWVCNLIDDDVERHGGTWGANTMGPANAILDFFGEEQELNMVRIFHNVGSTISIEEEMSEHIRLYVCDDERCSHFGRDEENIDIVEWKNILDVHMEMKEKWNTYFLEKPIKAKYVRIELVKNFGTPADVPWTETAELKLFPAIR